MKLHYYDFERLLPGGSNFGDNLNLWLWDRLLPGVFDDDPSTVFVGIGTILRKHEIPKADKTIVFSSGVGYGETPKPDDTWTIYCVRGPLSARSLGISADVAITDGALLVRREFRWETIEKRHPFSYMPHVWQAHYGRKSWGSVCKRLGFGFIDPCQPVERVMTGIAETEVIITEAMHGAIIADAFRIPWIPVRTHQEILDFKWKDWTSSVCVEYKPKSIVPLFDLEDELAREKRARSWIKQKIAAVQLSSIARFARTTLSNEKRLDYLLSSLERKLETFKRDVAEGKFQPRSRE